MKPMKKYADNLSRFRDEIAEFSKKFGGLEEKKSTHFKRDLSRKEKRKLERKLKSAKRLAYSKHEKMPTFESFVKSTRNTNKKQTQANMDRAKTSVKRAFADDDEDQIDDLDKFDKKQELKPSKKQPSKAKSADSVKQEPVKRALSSIELVEQQIRREKNEKNMYQKSTQESVKNKFQEDNEKDDEEIHRLEKLLHIKKGDKKYKKAFYEEGFDEILDFCDEDKRKNILKNEANFWLGTEEDRKKTSKDKTTKNIDAEEDNSDQSEIDDEGQDEEEEEDDFFIDESKKSKKGKASKEEEEDDEEPEGSEDDDEGEEMSDEDEMMEDEGSFADETDEQSEEEEEGDEFGDELTNESDFEGDSAQIKKSKKPKKEVKEDIYGRLIGNDGKVLKDEKYVPPAQRLKQLLDQPSQEQNVKLLKLGKQLNGLLNRLSASNLQSISNQIVQLFYSNEYTRYDLIQTIYNLLTNAVIKELSLTPIRLIIEHAALAFVLSVNIGIEFGATLLQKLTHKLKDSLLATNTLRIENKTLDNLILYLCNLYHFKLVSSNLIVDILNECFIKNLNMDAEDSQDGMVRFEKNVDLILVILRNVGFSLRKDNPIALKDLIVDLQSKVNGIKNKLSSEKCNLDEDAINNRLKFMLESVNAIKNNDMRRLTDAFDYQPIEQIRKQMKTFVKEDKEQVLLNVTYKDLINANELGRWWIVGSAWNLKENTSKDSKEEKLDNSASFETDTMNGQVYSEKILKLAKAQRMNTDVRRAIFCILLSAEDYTDAFVKLLKLSLKKQQEREIIYVIVHCALNEKKHNPYYSYLTQKFCEYDRRFKMTLQFHTWDKFKLLTSMTSQQISNFAQLYSHLISSNAMSLSVLKNMEFGEMNKQILQFLRELLTSLFVKFNNEQLQEIFMRVASVKKFQNVNNALKLFIVHFLLTDKGKAIEIDETLKAKCEFVQRLLTIDY